MRATLITVFLIFTIGLFMSYSQDLFEITVA